MSFQVPRCICEDFKHDGIHVEACLYYSTQKSPEKEDLGGQPDTVIPTISQGDMVSRDIYNKHRKEMYERGKQHGVEVGKATERARILEMVESLHKIELDHIDVGPIDIPDIETRGWNAALSTLRDAIVDKSDGI